MFNNVDIDCVILQNTVEVKLIQCMMLLQQMYLLTLVKIKFKINNKKYIYIIHIYSVK